MSDANNNDFDDDAFEPLIQPGQIICASERVKDQEEGFRFNIRSADVLGLVGTAGHRVDETLPAFVIRFDGVVHAYLNRCAHVEMELDWQPGQFFTMDRTALICASHDAQYLPDTGECISGPCPRGAKLFKLDIEEKNGKIILCQAKS